MNSLSTTNAVTKDEADKPHFESNICSTKINTNVNISSRNVIKKYTAKQSYTSKQLSLMTKYNAMDDMLKSFVRDIHSSLVQKCSTPSIKYVFQPSAPKHAKTTNHSS